MLLQVSEHGIYAQYLCTVGIVREILSSEQPVMIIYHTGNTVMFQHTDCSIRSGLTTLTRVDS